MKDACTSCSLDLLFSLFGEELRLDDQRSVFGQEAITKNLVETLVLNINDWSLGLSLSLQVVCPVLLTEHCPQIPHTYFTKVTWMVFVKVDPVVMLTTSITTTTRMLPVFANTSMSVADMTTELPGLLL